MTEVRTLRVTVWRGGELGRFVDYDIPRSEHQTVLDAVTYIQRNIDATLSYRFACRVGMCGSCAMAVNGVPRWTCRTHVDKVAKNGGLELSPLKNLPVIKDLAVDMAVFFDKMQRAKSAFVAHADPPEEFAVVAPASRERREADAAVECIGCGVCYSACDVVSGNRDYLGPAALNRAWSLINDVRDAGNAERLRAAAGDAGCHACHTHQSCRTWCPKSLNPTASISGLKRAAARAAMRGDL
ncbi:MAG TPA: succinate dehydrogenase/fumarate reductase iron-sulfur subunit [Gammaproteobacteria bacterium]